MKKTLNVYTLYISVLFIVIMGSCASKTNSEQSRREVNNRNKLITLHDLNNGDLIFVGAIDEGLSGAIKNSTFNYSTYNFDHVGMIERTKDSVFVLHATPKGGSQREVIQEFYKNQKRKDNTIIIYRLKKDYHAAIPSAIENAKAMLGKPYNWTYILNEEEYYCSDFIERAFRNDSIFEHIPMNFKNNSTGEFESFWIDLYQSKKLEIPQDQPGTNPNQFSTSPKLELIGPLHLSILK